ncbi:hypothetical protein [Agromyces cerinus]|uniref:Uncharacterized protein n=1 Tax=Agromyces cerinus subsp. cerinus TaxID=232089 RepID=A0A1N6G735_9MICO|nr:hypothetical protein [Agromyces cerinus]SIO03328.1 hypothetical protein SAMN05443544_2349 [Agromyces cerinus subsp. cerinus]
MTDDSRGEEPQQTIPETTAAAPAPEVDPEPTAPVAAPIPETPTAAEAPAPEALEPAAPAPVAPAPAAPADVPAAPAPAAPAAPAYVPVAPAPLQPADGMAPPPKKGLGTGAILGIVGGGLVVLIALIAAIVFAIGAVRGIAGGGSPFAGGGSAEETVEGYLTAIADGDAETARSFLYASESSSPLLTDEVLATSQELAPLTDIVIGEPEVTGGYALVPVTYSIGDTPVTTEISVSEDSEGWTIPGGTGQLAVYQLDGLEPTINGVPVSGEYVDAFPGAYEYGVTVDGFALEGENVVVVTAPSEYPDTSGMDAVLTPEAAEAFRQAVSASIDVCIASKTLEAGCGLTIPATLSDGTELTEGTITRTLPAETRAEIGAFEPELSYDAPTLVTGGYLGVVEVTAECTKDGATGTCSVLFGPSFGTPSLNLATEGAVVEWD